MRTGLLLLCTAAATWAAEPAEIRDAAAKAIALIQASQKQWPAKQSCISCHHQFQPALMIRDARAHGIPFDETIAHGDFVHAFANTSPGGASLADLDRAVQYNHVIEPAVTDAYRLVAADAAGVQPSLAMAAYARILGGRQNAEGDFDSFHQRPPSSYSGFMMTALSLRAIQLYSHPNQKAETDRRIALARRWLLSHEPRSIEDLTHQMFGLHWSGGDRAAIEKAAKRLLARQRPDGGWNSRERLESDAYSTGTALVALHDAGGVAIADPAWQRGIEFLLKTQMPDGSWRVKSRLNSLPVSPPYFESGYPYGHDQFISAQGSAWAVMALARALGPAKTVSAPLLKEAAPAGVEPWMETAMFGSAAELKKLLDGGLDPNSATKAGTTALMLAAPDVDKMKLLLDAGANVNARAETGFSALMVAAQYRESAPAMNLLLDRGAEVAAPEGVKPLFSAFPLFLAAYSGNAAILPRLHKEGDSLSDFMLVIGSGMTTPLEGAVRFADFEVIGTLLDLGVEADEVAPNGMNALHRAVLGNLVDVVGYFIQHGADVNAKDNQGMSPLLYAASTDFGDTEMVDLLLDSGADVNARDRNGQTALDLAKKYGHAYMIESLTRAAQRAAR